MAENIITALSNVRDHTSHIQKLANDLTSQCEEADEIRRDGVSLLQAKYATLMRYNLNLARLALARVRGDSIAPIASKLVQDTVALSKLRPIERKLQHHIDLVLKGSESSSKFTHGGLSGENNAQLRPNPSNIVLDEEEEDGESPAAAKRTDDEEEQGVEVYKPPKLAEVVFDPSVEKKRERKQREHERFTQRALRSETIREMVADIRGLPEQVGADGYGDASKSSKVMAQLRREDQNRRKFEERNFTRLVLSGKDKKRRRQLMREAGAQEVEGSNDFKGLSSMADRVIGPKLKKARAGDDDEELKSRRLDEALDDE